MRELPQLAPLPVDGAQADARYRVEGMDCASCARTLEKVVNGVEGVRGARVSFGSASLELWGDPTADAVMAAVAGAGFAARPAAQRRSAAADVPFWRRDARTLSTALALLVVAVAGTADLISAPRAVAEPLYLLAMAIGGWPIARAALVSLRRRSLDMNVLMTVAGIGAVAIGSYAEGAAVVVLFALGTTLETFALDRTRRSVEALAELAPDEARLITVDAERLAAVGDVPVGARIRVRPGERMPLDGVIESGFSSVDESPINGESVPVDRGPGDAVYAGSLNQLGAIVVRTTRLGADSTIARIVELVEQAQGSRAPSERFIDRFARIYTPLVVAVALLVAALPPLLAGADVSTWIYRALALLIVACPCSLVISIPVAIVSAIGAAARSGVLIKGGAALEDLARVRVLALDKTGTLTTGTPRLTSIEALAVIEHDEALRLLASLERSSEHPLAAALVRAAADRGIALGSADDLAALPGRGVDARIDGRDVWAGGPRLARERLGALPASIPALEAAGETVIVLGEGDRALAAFGLRDEPRPAAREAVNALRRNGIARIVMLTGDNPAVARSVANGVGIDEVHASLLPADKVAHVRALEQEAGSVAMVGDGVNDAPALAAARVGVAMGAAGSGVALGSASVALMGDDLSRLPVAISLARDAVRVMRQNVVASLLVKGALVLLVPFGLVTLWMAVAADVGMSLLVTINALRLLRRGEGRSR